MSLPQSGMEVNARPIGIFDSGVGGLTVANAVVRLLPREDIRYFGDIAHLPYGDKSPEAIVRYADAITRFLIAEGCKMIVVACNSASAAAHDYLHRTYGHRLPIIDVVDPLVEEVARRNYRKVGLLATKATVASGIYERELQRLAPQLEVAALAAPLLVPMIEEDFSQKRISHAIIKHYIHRDMFLDIDAMLLCCTHYPLIKAEIQQLFPAPIDVMDNADVVARRLRQELSERGWLNPQSASEAEYRFFVSDYTRSFEETARLFYGESISLEPRSLF